MGQTTKTMQKYLLEALKWFHEYCIAHELCYYALGGTMLGAVRHQGFIPWDDDIDVGMPREDYERFLTLAEGKDLGIYIVESFQTGKDDYIYPFAKVYDRRTTLVEDARVPVKRGIYLDVFPLDGASDTEEEAYKIYKKIKLKYNLLLMKVCAFNKERSFYKNISILFGRLIPNFILSKEKLLKEINNECKKVKFYQSEYVGNFVGNWGKREIIKRTILGKPKEYQFENIKIFGVENYDGYLSKLYGDYMTLPPVEKRKSHHIYLVCMLTKSYIEK